ncbi:MAG: class I SAM-dependent methyltransferase, partial [Polyangiaceae bacterium]
DRFMKDAEAASLHIWRAELLAHAHGDVLEVGAGTGINLPAYPKLPDPISSLTLAEPDPHMRKHLEARVAALGMTHVNVVDAPIESLPFPAASFDVVVCTLVLCSVASPKRALEAIHAVLRPKGQLLFLEHVAAVENPSRLGWQKRIEPFWKIIGDGCHLTRDTLSTIESSGFSVQNVTHASMRKALPILRPTSRGIAAAV